MKRKTLGRTARFALSLSLGASIALAQMPGTTSAPSQGPAPGPTASSGWTLVSEGPHELDASIHETVWRTSRPPGAPHDQIEVHRYRAQPASDAEPAAASQAALVYLPGTNMNGEAALGDENHNLWFYLARRGVEVWALDYRTHFVANSGVEDLAFMSGWGLATFVGDAAHAAALARSEGGHESVFVAGFSRGVTLAYALAATEPKSSVAGVVAFDGTFKSHAPKGEYDLAAAREEFSSAGIFASDVAGSRGWEWRRKLMADTAADPKAPAQNEPFETIGEELAAILHGAWGPGALANPIDGFSRPVILARLLAGYDRYYPTVQNVEGRSLADHLDDPSTPIDDGWAELDLPVLYFGSTGMQRLLGPRWLLDGIHSAAEAGGKDFTIHVLEGYGHLDVLVGESARADVFEPTLAWIERHLP